MEGAAAPTLYDLPRTILKQMLTSFELASLDAAMLPGDLPVVWKREAAVVAASEGDHKGVKAVVDDVKARCPLKKRKPDSRWESMLLKIAEAAAAADCEKCLMIAMREQHEYRSVYKNRFSGYQLIEDKVIERAAAAAAKADYDLFFWYMGNNLPLSKLSTDVSITDAALSSSARRPRCMEWLWYAVKRGADCSPATRQFLRINHWSRWYDLGIP